MGFVAFSSRRSRLSSDVCYDTPVLRGGACPCGPRPRTARASSSVPSWTEPSEQVRAVSAGGTQAAVGSSVRICVHR